jgi:peptide/nickel transport system substrate-binding protein
MMAGIWKHAMLTASAAMISVGVSGAAYAQTSIEVALFGEPPGLDPVIYSNDAASTVTQHFFETLFTFSSNWEIAPLLASDMPSYSEDATVVTIPIRTDAVFHNGEQLTVEDVVASLERWIRSSSRGQVAGVKINSIEADGDDKVVIRLKEPFAPLLPLLAYNSSAAIIVPAAHNAVEGPLTEFIGTGPYKLIERRPDQFTRVGRFDEYVSPPGAADGYAGERKAIIDEVRFVPVPNPATRIAGVVSGQFVFADAIPTEAFAQIEAAQGVQPVPVQPSWVTFTVLNNKGGATQNVEVRQAMQAAINPAEMLAAAIGIEGLYEVHGSIFPEGTPYYSLAGTDKFNLNDPELAKQLLEEAGYDGEPIRLLTSQQLDPLYKQTLVAKENLERAGFTVDVQVMDWVAVTQKRLNPEEWEGFIAWHAFTPEPSALTFVSADYPGWWDTDEKRALMTAFTSEVDEQKRTELWAQLQELLYEQSSTLIHGQFSNLTAVSDRLEGYVSMPWPSFWNVELVE